MFKSYLRIALRNIKKNPVYSFINIGGLMVSIACCLLIFQYVSFELSFDTFNKNASEIHRINQSIRVTGNESGFSGNTGWAFGPTVLEEVPEVTNFARIHPEYNNAIVSNPEYLDVSFEEEHVFYADPSFLQIFSYPIVLGDRKKALSEPGTILLSESAASKYFGTENPIGKTLDVEGRIGGNFRITGIFKDVPKNSHLQFDILLPMLDLLEKSDFKDPATGWNWTNFITYVQMHNDTYLPESEAKFKEIFLTYRGEVLARSNRTAEIDLQPLTDIRLNDSIQVPKTQIGSYRSLYFFSIIGCLTLLLALVNYINLTTARALNRTGEVGVRKTLGANKTQLVNQFLVESAITILASTILAFVCIDLALPAINKLMGITLSGADLSNVVFWEVLFAMLLLTIPMAGFYPSFFLASFKPMDVLKTKSKSFTKGLGLRKGLFIFQFTVCIALITGTLIIHSQLRYIQSMNLGIEMDQIISVSAPRILPDDLGKTVAVETFVEEVSKLSDVQMAATSFNVPGSGFMASISVAKDRNTSERITAGITEVDAAFSKLYGLEFIVGEGFERILPTDEEIGPSIINETALQELGFKSPEEALDKEIQIFGNPSQVLAVFKDVNWSSAHNAVKPTILLFSNGNPRISLKINTDNLSETLSSIEKVYKDLFPGNPYLYSFVDEQFNQQYKNDASFAGLFSVFASLAILIACLGLFALVTLASEQRTKEIGIRKVLGASVLNIVSLLSIDFIKLVAIGFIIAAPISWYVMNRWLTEFAYRINIGFEIFLFAGVIALTIAFFTTSWQSVKAANSNPVDSLKSE